MNLENLFHIEATDCRTHRLVNKEAGTPGTKHTSMDNVDQFVFVTYTFKCYILLLTVVHMLLVAAAFQEVSIAAL